MGTPTGTYRDPEKARQLCLFEGLYHKDGCYPTDGDYHRDFNLRLFVDAEFKHGLETKLTTGQELHYEAVADVFKRAGTPYVFVFARHEVPETEDFYAKDCIVSKVLMNGQWRWDYKGWAFGRLEAWLLVLYAKYLR